MLPGAEEVLALLELRDQARSERWDVVVVDCAPTAETLRLLALPEALSWYVDSACFPVERRVVKALQPVLTRAAGVPMPRDHVFDARRAAARRAGGGPRAARPARTPRSGSCSRRSPSSWRRHGGPTRRSRCTATASTVSSPTGSSPAGAADDLAGRLGGCAPGRGAGRGRAVVRAAAGLAVAVPAGRAGRGRRAGRRSPTERVRRRPTRSRCPPVPGPSASALRVAARPAAGPAAAVSRADVDLARHGDELVVTVGSYRRVLALPAGARPAPCRSPAAVSEAGARSAG